MINVVTLRGFNIKPKDFESMIHSDQRLPWIEKGRNSKKIAIGHINLSRMRMCYLRDVYIDENGYSEFLEKYIRTHLDSCRKNQEMCVISTTQELDFLIIRTIIKEDSKNCGGKIYCFGPDYDYKLNQYNLDIIDIDKNGRFDSQCELFMATHKYLSRLI